MDSGYEAITENIDSYRDRYGHRFTGIMAFCDMIAFGAYLALDTLGLRIPEDVSVIGYDNSPFSRLTSPPLTTVHFPVDRIAKHCSDILISNLVNNEERLQTYSLEPSLVERSSVAPITRQ